MATERQEITTGEGSLFSRLKSRVLDSPRFERLKHHTTSTLFVTACVTLLHVSTSWLDALDTYSFMWVSNVAASLAPSDQTSPRIAVVEIDDWSFDNAFSRRSPLKRDEIHRILTEIYETRPGLLVIDLDLAPADATILSEEEEQMEREIARLIAAKSGPEGTATVLLSPMPVTHRAWSERRQQWRDDLEQSKDARISFGHGGIPERFGMTNRFFADDESLYAAASRGAGYPGDFSRASSALSRNTGIIDPRVYLTKLDPVSVTRPKGDEVEALSCRIHRAFREECGKPGPEQSKRIVYFGAAFGEDDLFATPFGRLYGVEVHAAAFATGRESKHWVHALGIAIDFVVGFFLGLLITKAWKNYVEWRMHPNPEISAVAGIVAFRLMVLLAVALGAMTVLAGFAMAWKGVWISPIPIAIGMFVEAWVIGPISPHDPRHTSTTPATAAGPTLVGIAFTGTSLKLLKRLIWWPVVAVALLLTFLSD